jgi:hypothetical protein
MKRTFLISSVLLVGLLASISSNAQESKFKALFIYKFAEYIEWPDGSKDVTIGVAGKSDVYDELATFAASKANVTVIKINSPSEVSKCKILFLPDSQNAAAGGYKSAVGSKSILIVSDEKSLVGPGSDIGFFTEGGKLRFQLSESNIKQKKMVPSSKLLALAN